MNKEGIKIMKDMHKNDKYFFVDIDAVNKMRKELMKLRYDSDSCDVEIEYLEDWDKEENKNEK